MSTLASGGWAPRCPTSPPYMANNVHVQSPTIYGQCTIYGHQIPYMVMCINILIGWFQALRKKQLIASGQLGKFGKILETIPAAIKKEFEL